jgi:alpha-maltose-1-phosphate synthase
MTNGGGNAAIYYQAEAYDASRPKLMGRQAAGEGFLRGFARHARADQLYCYAADRDAFADFARRVARLGGRERPSRWIPFAELSALSEPGCLYFPAPDVARLAWHRRHHDTRAYSLCGLTHTTASHGVMDGIGAWLTAPLEPWDAVVCTSRAVKAMVEGVLDGWGEYLEERFGGRVRPTLELPVIPLGVDCDALAPTPTAERTRAGLRRRHGIGDEDVAVLFVGRLSFHAKAHPLPMYLGLEEAARRSGRRLHLIQAGWFANEAIERAFKDAARAFCPSVNAIFLDGREPEVRAGVWFAADVFTSLSDNIQETFGVAPVEAMAAGLPVVVSDWDGYRDTVRHGFDGFAVPTLLPPPGLGADLALRHALGVDSYDAYIGAASQFASVDIGACAEAYERLALRPELRRAMGEAGRRRARDKFDWRVGVAAYEELWHDLAERRRWRREVAPCRSRAAADPLRDDPFALFAAYPTAAIDLDATVALVPGADAARLAHIRGFWMNAFAADRLSPAEDCHTVLRRLSESGPCRVADLLGEIPGERAGLLHRSLGWLAKVGLVRITPPPPAGTEGTDAGAA